MPLRALPLALVATLTLAGAAASQSLAELAERERERRARQARPPARVYGDADLAAQRGSPKPAATASPEPAPSASPPPGEDEDAVRKRQAAEWRMRFAQGRERVARAEADAWRTVIDVVWVAGIPVQQQVRKFEETEELRQARKAMEDLEEEYRRTGLPPGWVR